MPNLANVSSNPLLLPLSEGSFEANYIANEVNTNSLI